MRRTGNPRKMVVRMMSPLLRPKQAMTRLRMSAAVKRRALIRVLLPSSASHTTLVRQVKTMRKVSSRAPLNAAILVPLFPGRLILRRPPANTHIHSNTSKPLGLRNSSGFDTMHP